MVKDFRAGHIVARLLTKTPAILAVLLLAAGHARAESSLAAKDDPALFLRDFSSQAIGVLADGKLSQSEREIAFRRLFTTGFDVDLISRFVLGRYWRAATKAQRSEYRQLFEDFIIETYGRRLNGYSGAALSLGRARALEEKGIIISSQVKRSQGPPINVDWRLRSKAGVWRIIDIEVEGVSWAVTQRSEFATVISNHGSRVEGLLEKLREKIGRRGVAKPF
jgi:phospholipid transport system substrate-binding protein